jgi:hypothetical protein
MLRLLRAELRGGVAAVVRERIVVRRVRRLLRVPDVVLEVMVMWKRRELTARLFRPRTSPGMLYSIVSNRAVH